MAPSPSKAPFSYSTLSEEDRANMARQRLAQYEQEHYAHELNKAAVAEQPADTPGRADAIKAATEAQGVLEAAMKGCRKEIPKG